MVPPRNFILGGAAALLVTFLTIALHAPWPGAWGFAAAAAWAVFRVVVDRVGGERVTGPREVAQILVGGALVFGISLLAP